MSDWKDDMDELRVGYLRRARERVTEALRFVDELAAEPEARPPLEGLHTLLHKLTGSAGCYGYPKVTVDAGAATHTAEELLENAKHPGAEELATIRAAIHRIATHLELPPTDEE